MFYVVVISAGVYLLDMFSLGSSFSSLLTFVPSKIFQEFQIWRLVTFIFVVENSSSIFVLISLYFYYFVGTTLESEWGSPRFTVYYGIGVLANILTGVVLSFLYGLNFPWYVVNMHYVNMSLFFAFACLYPNMEVRLFFILPVKVKWMGWFTAALFLWDVLNALFALYWIGVVLPLVAIGNFLLFFSGDAMVLFGRVKHKNSKQTINFKKATKDIRQQKGYLHKCTICGRTDTDHPELEFRYCSKCNGYHCYCMEHLNNHVHVE